MKRLTIAIDGPSGAGKSTVARGLAARLGYTYIDTGAMYRAIAWKTLRDGLDPQDEWAVTALARATRITFAPDSASSSNGDPKQRVFVEAEDVTDALRSVEVTRLSSPISALPGVRQVLVAQQQAMGAGGGVVMEGRDIGTVVFPEAEVKVFLTASEQERALRRWRERTAKGESVTVEEILEQQRERDARDSSRENSPLRPAEDSLLLNSDGIDVEGVIERILHHCRAQDKAQAESVV